MAGEGHGHPLQGSCLENPMDRGAWRATVLRVAESDTAERLSTHACAWQKYDVTNQCYFSEINKVLC